MGSILRSHVLRLFRTAELNPELRTFGELLKVLGGQYDVSAQERDVDEMGKLFELRRETRANPGVLGQIRYARKSSRGNCGDAVGLFINYSRCVL